jgi:TonB family protein
MEDPTNRGDGRFPGDESRRAPTSQQCKALVVAVAVIALSVWPRSGITQVVPTPELASSVYFEFQVDQPAVVLGSLGVTYPAELRSAGIEGNVRFQFVVDTTGRVEEGTLKAVASSNELFTTSGRLALLRAQFSPARIRQRKVRQLVELPMMFQISR